MALQSRFSIPIRIVAGLVLVLATFLTVSIYSLVQHDRISKTLRLLDEGYLPVALTLGEAKATQAVYTTLLERALEEDAAATRNWLKAAQRVRPVTLRRAYEGIEKAEALATALGDEKALRSVTVSLGRVEKRFAKLQATYDNLFELLDAGQNEETQALFEGLREDELQIQRDYRSAWRQIQKKIEKTSALAADQERGVTILLSVLGLVALIVGVAVIFWAQRILRPIPLLHQRVAAVARGDLSLSVDLPRDDELGQLLSEFEKMVAALAARDMRLREARLGEQRLQRMQVQIVEALRAAVLVVAPDRIVRVVNPAATEILGVSNSERSVHLDETSLGRKCPALLDAIQQVSEGGLPQTLEAQQLKGFDERLVDVLVTPFGDATEGEFTRSVLIVADDVTDAAATKSRLIQSERLAAIGRMAAHVTHEVRNPLSSVGLNVEMLADELNASDDESRALLKSIRQELNRLEGITEEYLRLARLPDPALYAENTVDIVRSTIDFVGREMETFGVKIELRADNKIPDVAVDEGQFRQALMNILRNAREAMPEGGTIRVDVQRYDHGVRVQVHDEGSGIPEDEVTRVFDLFYTTKERGTGLGLALTQQIIAAHGGTIVCKARHPKGTTFEVWLPSAAGDATASPMRRVG